MRTPDFVKNWWVDNEYSSALYNKAISSSENELYDPDGLVISYAFTPGPRFVFHFVFDPEYAGREQL
jgi:hypothetical protein